MAWTVDPAFRRNGLGAGSSRRAVERRHRTRRVGRAGGLRWRVARRSLLFGVRAGRVRAVAVADRAQIRTRRGLRLFLRRAR